MILIDVLVPPLDRIFDFEIDENVEATYLIKNVMELIARKEKIQFDIENRQMFLYRVGDFLKENMPLKDQGIINGDRVILV